MTESILILLPECILIMTGYFLCNYTRLDHSLWGQVDRLVYFFLFPLLLFRSVSMGRINIDTAGNFAVAGILLGIVSVGLVYLLPYLPLLGKRIQRTKFTCAAQVGFRFNSFIGLAIAYKYSEGETLFYMSLLIGMCVPIFNVAAVWPMSGSGGKNFFMELIKNPLIIGTVTGLAASFLELNMPEIVAGLLDRIGGMALTMGMLAVGAGMKFRSMGKDRLLTLSIMLCKHLLTPAVAFGISILFALTQGQTFVLVVFASLPTATSCYVLAKTMGYDGPYVGGLVSLSTVLGGISIPVAMALTFP